MVQSASLALGLGAGKSVAGRLALAASAGLGRACERGAYGSGTGGLASLRDAGMSVWRGFMAGANRTSIGIGEHAPGAGETEEG